MKNKDSEFREIQRIPLKWIAVLGIVIGSTAVIMKPIYFLTAALSLPLYFVKLVTRVHKDVVKVKLWPFQRSFSSINIEEIESAEIIEFGFFTYGGIGIRFTPNNIAYLTKPGKGVKLVRADSKDVVIGSQKPDQLLETVEDKLVE